MSLDRDKGDPERGHPFTTLGAAGEVSALTGLPLRVDRAGRVEFLEGLPRVEPQPRALDQMRSVLYNQTSTGPDPLYYMYRDMGWPEDKRHLSDYNLRYDLTVLVPGLVGGEYVKTAGHYHPAVGEKAGRGNGSDGEGQVDSPKAWTYTYPELYQVVSGRAHYLMQKPAEGGAPGSAEGGAPGSLEDVVIVEAGPGDTLYVPPGYGHVTINPGPEPLVMVNVVCRAFSSVYGPYRERHGAAYYEVEENGQGYFIPNGHYPEPPQPRLGRTTDLAELGLTPGQPLYAQVTANPRIFTFLSQPPRGGPMP